MVPRTHTKPMYEYIYVGMYVMVRSMTSIGCVPCIYMRIRNECMCNLQLLYIRLRHHTRISSHTLFLSGRIHTLPLTTWGFIHIVYRFIFHCNVFFPLHFISSVFKFVFFLSHVPTRNHVRLFPVASATPLLHNGRPRTKIALSWCHPLRSRTTVEWP